MLAWLILGSLVSPVGDGGDYGAVAGIMVALSVDELMPLAKEIDPNNNPSYGVLCGMSVMGLSLVALQAMGLRRLTAALFGLACALKSFQLRLRALIALVNGVALWRQAL